MIHHTATRAIRRHTRQLWRDLLSVYYANTPIWRWLKSAALLFLGFFAWTGGAVLLSVKPEWSVLTYVMAYGFVLIVWGPFTHFVVVPVTIRLRRNGRGSIARIISRNAGKINLTVFFTIVVLFGTLTPGVMMLEFSPSFVDGESTDVRGELRCETTEELVSCHIENPHGIDHVVVTSGGETLATVDEPPFEFELSVDEIGETRTGKEFTVDYRNAEGETVKRQIERVSV